MGSPIGPLSGMTVMVNPGHNAMKDGYFDTGTKGKLGKKTVTEAYLNDKVAQNVKRKFELLGAKVIFVEKTKIQDIRDLENKIHPDLFIAIHHDGKGPGKAPNSGETVYCWGPSQEVGKYINDEFKKDKTVKNNPNSTVWAKDLCVLKADPTINAVLVEVGYMTNPKELKVLNSPEYQDKAAQMIVDGSRNFLAKKKKEASLEENKTKETKEINKFPLLFDSAKVKKDTFPNFFIKPVGFDM